jgi:endonuclease III
MRREQKAEQILAILDQLFPDPEIPLTHSDPFTLLVAVVLSAQTTDKKVNEVTPGLFSAASTPEALAQMSVATIQEHIRTVGLAPQKARALQGLSERLVKLHGGNVPGDFDALIQLPGVGQKTANVVMAQAFGVPSFPVDTHIYRLAGRWGLSRAKTAEKTEEDLKLVFPRDRWNVLHLQMIYFGRSFCPALRHDFDACPICSWAASKSRRESERTRVGEAARRRSKSAGHPA